MSADEERIALFLDYENLAIGARENLGGMVFDLKPVADALAERGRVVVRRAYADWLKFGEDGRMLTRHHVELIEIPQRMGTVRKNAADIKMAVDAVELCLERDYITTFVLGTGDSDFTPLVHKLREHNKQVIGLGIQMSTSALLPPACDEFLFYERLEGVEVPKRRAIVPRGRRGRRPQVGDVGVEVEAGVEAETGVVARRTIEVEVEAGVEVDSPVDADSSGPTTISDVEKLLTQTLSGLERSSGSVRASSLKRAVLRKESTFNEADYGFRGFTELLRSLAERGVVELAESASPGDPDVQFPSGENVGQEGAGFELLATMVERLDREGSGTPLSGLKTQLRRQQPDFSEKRFGFGGFLQFAKAAVTRGVVAMAWSDEADDYLLTAVAGRPTFETSASAPKVPSTPATGAVGPVRIEPADRAGAPGTGQRPPRRAARPASPSGEAVDSVATDSADSDGDGITRARRSRGGRGRNARGQRTGDEGSPTPGGFEDGAAESAPPFEDQPDDEFDIETSPGASPGADVPASTPTADSIALAESVQPAKVTPPASEPVREPAPASATSLHAQAGPAKPDAEVLPAEAPAEPKRRRRTTKATTSVPDTYADTDADTTSTAAPEPTADPPAKTPSTRARTTKTGTSRARAATRNADPSEQGAGDAAAPMIESVDPAAKKPAVRRRRAARPAEGSDAASPTDS